ncbi:hypothetical protein, partial [Moraxella catarrhalis]|uniref:hypothetical protein n=6 Tax=Moraxella catarrhalis TaxID=480 RepID=UPI001EEF5C6F
FELSVGYEPTPVFKTGAFNRSAKLPMRRIIDEFFVNARIFYKNWHNFVIFKHQLPMGDDHGSSNLSIKAKLRSY